MSLDRKYRVNDSLVNELLTTTVTNKILKVARQGTTVSTADAPTATVWVDGPMTFALVKCLGKEFTGWSKFNANDQNYSKLTGVCRALKRAVDALFENEVSVELTKLTSEVSHPKQTAPKFKKFSEIRREPLKDNTSISNNILAQD